MCGKKENWSNLLWLGLKNGTTFGTLPCSLPDQKEGFKYLWKQNWTWISTFFPFTVENVNIYQSSIWLDLFEKYIHISISISLFWGIFSGWCNLIVNLYDFCESSKFWEWTLILGKVFIRLCWKILMFDVNLK